jgi:hypothetical protein
LISAKLFIFPRSTPERRKGKLVIFDYKSLLGFYGLSHKKNRSSGPRKAYYIFHNDWMYSKTSSYFIERDSQAAFEHHPVPNKKRRTLPRALHSNRVNIWQKYLNPCFCVNISGWIIKCEGGKVCGLVECENHEPSLITHE